MSSISPSVRVAPGVTTPQPSSPASAQESARPAQGSLGPQASPRVSGPLADLAISSRSRSALLRHWAPRIAPHIPPALDGAAAAADLAEGFLTSPNAARALKISSATSGVAWAAGAIASELDNQLGDLPRSNVLSVANLFSAIAGGLSAALPYAPTYESTGIGYGSSSAWIGAAAATVAAGAGAVRFGDTFAKVLQGGSGMANGVAAALAEAATKAAAENQPSQAAALTIASGAMWLVASVAAEGAVLRDSQIRSRANQAGEAGASQV